MTRVRYLLLCSVLLAACGDPGGASPSAVDDAFSTDEDVTLVVAAESGLLANDGPVSASATVALVAGPSFGTLTLAADGGFTYAPAANFSGRDSFTYALVDGGASAGTATVSLSVQAVNDPPVAAGDSYTLAEDSTLNVAAASGVLANDTDLDGDTLTVTVVAAPASGQLTLAANGGFTYQPAADFAGDDGFVYAVSDGARSSQGTVALLVTAVADPPAPADDQYALDEDTVLTVAAGSGVLANDTDPDGDALTAALVVSPTHGALVFNPDGSLEYTPSADYFGNDSFGYEVSDGSETRGALVELQINPVNDAPVAVNDVATTAEDTTLTIASPGVLTNDTDIENDTLAVTAYTQPASGTLTIAGDGELTYQPPANFYGSVSFTYTISDGALTATATGTITVNAVNDLPAPQSQTFSTYENTAHNGQLVATDVEGDLLTYAVDTSPAHGLLSITASTGAFTYTPTTDYVGGDSFTFTASDSGGASLPGTVSITVLPTPVPTIASLYPAFGTTGVPLQIHGSQFGAAAGSVTIGGAPVTVSTWTDHYVVVDVPVGLAAGNHEVIVTAASARSSTAVAYEVRPWILAIEPTSAAANEVISISGDSFGSATGTVEIGGVSAVIESWSSGTIEARVPAGTAGLVHVRVLTAAGGTSNAAALTRRGFDMWLPSTIPSAAQAHQAYWTGADMIVWTNTWGRAWRYEPRGDRRVPMSPTGMPAGGASGWTGTELIVYGSAGSGRYDAFEDQWSPISTGGMPAGGASVWTGSELVVWGASLPGSTANAARYDPSADSWSAVSATGAPSMRREHALVWTGSEVFVWGGYDGSASLGVNDGALYNPATNTWRPVSAINAPPARRHVLAVWTGTHVIVWGGADPNNGVNSGGIYDPATDTWATMTTSGAPIGGRGGAAAWTGTHLVVWGGYSLAGGYQDTGGRYDPATDTWAPTSTTGRPARRGYHSFAWTGKDVIVWGGFAGSSLQHTGGIYTAPADAWSPMLAGIPVASRSVAWTGAELVVLGQTGGRFDPAASTWTPVSSSKQITIYQPSTVWTGSEVITWGGYSSTSVSFGTRYEPSTDAWTATASSGAPSARHQHVAAWSGSELLVWGGHTGTATSNTNGSFLNTGGRYAPATDSWTAMTTVNAPSARRQATGAWTGSELLVWGGYYFAGSTSYPADGGRYDPSTDTWTAMSAVNAPAARRRHVAVWTGTELLVWGGENGSGALPAGGRYNPAADTWSPMSTAGQPAPRVDGVATWTGTEMLVWGGFGADGGAYNPSTDSWRSISTTGAPTPGNAERAVWTGREVIVWGDDNDLGIYLP